MAILAMIINQKQNVLIKRLKTNTIKLFKKLIKLAKIPKDIVHLEQQLLKQ